jgi:hypothetical protein
VLWLFDSKENKLDNLITRVEDESYLQTVARAMTTSDPRTAGSDYHRMDYSEVLTVANTEHTPLSNRISRREAMRDIKHFWLEQEIPGAGVVTPLAETADPAENTRFLPKRYENNILKIGRKFIITDLMNIIARAGGLHAVGTDEWGRQMQMQLSMFLRDQEAAIIKAVLSDSSPLSMRGLLGDIENANDNGWIGLTADGGVEQSGIKDLGGNELVAGTPSAGQQNIEKVLNDYMLQMYNLNAGPLPTVVYVSPRAFYLLQTAAKSKVTVMMSQAELNQRAAMNLGGAVGKYYTDFGMIDFVAHPLLSAALPGDLAAVKEKSSFMFLHEPGISLVDIVGYGGVHIEPRAKTDPTEIRVISEIISLEVRYLKSHGRIKNFSIAA